MGRSSYLALGLMATMGCRDGKSDTETEPVDTAETCERTAYLGGYPNPMIEHADRNPLTDVANTVSVLVQNVGGADCPAAELQLYHGGNSYLLDTPELAPEETAALNQKGLVFDDASNQDFTVYVEGEEIGAESFETRQVGSVLRGQMADFMADEFGLDTETPCEDDLDIEVPAHSSYCEPMREAANQGWFSEGREYDTLNHAELAAVVVRAYPDAFVGFEGETPCPDLSSSEWYYDDMQTLVAWFPDLEDGCVPEADTLIHELYGATYPDGGILDRL